MQAREIAFSTGVHPLNIMMLLEMAVAGYGDRVAFVDAEAQQSITYQGLFRCSLERRERTCVHPRRPGLRSWDVSNLAIPIGLFASSWAGMPYVPISYRLTDDENRRTGGTGQAGVPGDG